MSENALVNPNSDSSVTVSFPTRPRVSLQHKLLLLTVLMTVLPTLVSVSWISRLTRDTMNQHHAHNVQLLAKAMADQMAFDGKIVQDRKIASQISSFNLDQRLSFILISDGKQRLMYRRALHAKEWMDYQQWLDAAGVSLILPIIQPLKLGPYGEMAVARVPIWHYPQKLAFEQGIAVKGPRQLLGYLTIAVSDRTLPQTLGYLRSIQISAALLVCVLVLPAVLLIVRNQIRPLNQLIEASINIAQGHYPPLEDIHRSDEIGLLNKSFNLMIQRLKTHQNVQDQLHEDLENKVVERTHELEQLNQQLAQTVKQFESLAATDSLTGLANRREISKTLKRCFLKAQHYRHGLACIMLDMDGFKLINDSLGHQVGDEVLCLAAKALSMSCRDTDVAGRYGGDEFVVVLPKANEETAISVAVRIREQFDKQINILLYDKAELASKITLSMGVAIQEVGELLDSERMLANADTALYRAKNTGKNRILIYNAQDIDNHRTTEILPTHNQL